MDCLELRLFTITLSISWLTFRGLSLIVCHDLLLILIVWKVFMFKCAFAQVQSTVREIWDMELRLRSAWASGNSQRLKPKALRLRWIDLSEPIPKRSLLSVRRMASLLGKVGLRAGLVRTPFCVWNFSLVLVLPFSPILSNFFAEMPRMRLWAPRRPHRADLMSTQFPCPWPLPQSSSL